MKTPIKYFGRIVGYTSDGQTIDFLDNDHARKLRSSILDGDLISISFRQFGIVDINGKITHEDIPEYGIMNLKKEMNSIT